MCIQCLFLNSARYLCALCTRQLCSSSASVTGRENSAPFAPSAWEMISSSFPLPLSSSHSSSFIVHRSSFKLYLLPSLAEGPGESLSPFPIYYIIRCIPLPFGYYCPFYTLFLIFLKKSFPFLCRFAEKSYLCTRKTGTPPTSQAGGCFCCATKKEFFDRFS